MKSLVPYTQVSQLVCRTDTIFCNYLYFRCKYASFGDSICTAYWRFTTKEVISKSNGIYEWMR